MKSTKSIPKLRTVVLGVNCYDHLISMIWYDNDIMRETSEKHVAVVKYRRSRNFFRMQRRLRGGAHP
jgi:hypothetical protein